MSHDETLRQRQRDRFMEIVRRFIVAETDQHLSDREFMEVVWERWRLALGQPLIDPNE